MLGKRGISTVASVVIIVAIVVALAILFIAAIGAIAYFWLMPPKPTSHQFQVTPQEVGKVMITYYGDDKAYTSGFQADDPGVNMVCDKVVLYKYDTTTCNLTGTPLSQIIIIMSPYGKVGEVESFYVGETETQGLTEESEKEWQYAGHEYIREITIDNTKNNNDLSDYSIAFTLNTESLIYDGKMKPDCSDVRFKDAQGQKLDYWLDEETCDTSSTKIYVKIPHTPGGGITTIYMDYGDPDAQSESDGSKVFLFFEDFNDDTLDTSKWPESYMNNDCGEINETNQRLEMYECEYKGEVYLNSSVIPISLTETEGLELSANVNTDIGGSSSVGNPELHLVNPTSNAWIAVGHTRWRDKDYVKDSDSSSPFYFADAWDGLYTYSIYVDSNSYRVDTGSGNYTSEDSPLNNTSEVVIKLKLSVGGSGSECNYDCLRIYWDNVRLRKYVSPEPDVIIGEEEIVS